MTSELLVHHTPVNLYFGAEFDHFNCLPEVCINLWREKAYELASVRTIMLEFFGESFIRRTILRSGESCNNRYAGCLLLCYAYYLVITGKGSNASLMWLKGNVINLVRQAVSDPKKMASLDTMIAVMALGTPIVCGMTDPKSPCLQLTKAQSSSSHSLFKTTSSGAAPSVSAENPSTEYDMHYLAVTSLLRMQTDPAYLTTADGRYVFLVKVISNAHQMLTVPFMAADAWIRVFQKFELYSTKSQPDVRWNSPLFCPSRLQHPQSIKTQTQNDCLKLAQVARDWFVQYKSMRGCKSNQIDLVRCRLQLVLNAPHSVRGATDSNGSAAMYDACCLVIKLMTESADRGCPLSAAAAFVPRAAELPYILKRTDLLHLWGDFSGLLYWVTLISHVISQRSQERMISTLILAHFTQVFSASQIPLAAALRPLQELLEYP